MTDYDAQPGREPPADLSSSQREADEIDLAAGLRGLAGLVAGGRSLSTLLSHVTEFAADAIPGTDGLSIALAEPPRLLTATADFVVDIDSAQYHDLNEGPCLTCMQTHRVTVSGSLGSDDRWPHFGGRVARMGVHSALSLPLVVGDVAIGAINVYARDRDAFGDHAVRLGTRFAAPAAVSLYNAQLLAAARARAEQLQQAISHRAVIDQAIGIIRSRSGGDAEEAFARLRHQSQADNVKLVVVAERLVEEAVRRARARKKT